MSLQLSTLLLALLGSPEPPAEEEAGTALFFFVQLTDPQLGMYEENREFARETANLSRAVDHVNRLRPAFVVVTGDLVNRPGDQEQAREYLRILGGVDPAIPVHSVPGNHDLGDPPTPEKLAWFRETFGPDHGAFAVKGWRFLFINSTLLYEPKAAPGEAEEERRWLLSQLALAGDGGDRRLILFQHHPWFVNDPGEADSYFNAHGSLRLEYLSLLKKAGVRAVFAGHAHAGSRARDGGLEMVTSPPVGKPLGKEPSGLRIVWVFQDHIEHRYFGLDQVPLEVPARSPAHRRRF